MRTKNQMIKSSLLVVLLTLSSVCMQAQVTIGGSAEPQKFSALEIISNGTGGLRLPQLNNTEKQALEKLPAFIAEKQGKAKGLMIFNTENVCLEIWNGEKWIIIK